MLLTRYFAGAIAAVSLMATTASLPAGQQVGQPSQEETARLVEVLESDAPVFDKAMACRRLGMVGGPEAVDPLSTLLADEKLATYARGALEVIDNAAADRALRDAAGRVEGELLKGVLNSIGKRRDPGAVDLLVPLLKSDDRAVAGAAASALGNIGNHKSAEILQKTLAEADEPFRRVAAGACLVCARRLQQHDDPDTALALYDAVAKADVPDHLSLSAVHSSIVLRGEDGLSALGELLDSADDARFRCGLQAARELGTAGGRPLVARFGRESSRRKALLILALGDIGDESALPLIREAVADEATDVRVEAIRSLGRFADRSAGEILLDAAIGPNEDVSQAARSALALIDGDEIDDAVIELLASDKPDVQMVAVDLAGRRRIGLASAALFELSDSDDAGLCGVALKSLGSTIDLDNLPKLIALAINPEAADKRSAATEALEIACARLPQEACAERMAVAMKGASTEAKIVLLDEIAAVGGSSALATVVAAARSGEDALEDAATRLLGEWMTADVAPELLDLSKRLDDAKYRIRALRGYVRVARQLDMTPHERLEVCRNALAVAERNPEKGLVLDTLGQMASTEALEIAVGCLDEPALAKAACVAAVSIGEKIVEESPAEVGDAMRKVLAATTDQALSDRARSLISRTEKMSKPR